jgi:hypothetical protein
MRKKYNRKSKLRKRKSSALKPGFYVIIIFALGLLMIWKSNKVKDDYSKTKKLEKAKNELIAEISEYRAELMDLKSISHVGKVVRKYGLTQNVAERLTIEIPRDKGMEYDRKLLVDMDSFADWLEEAVLRSGKVNAGEQKEKVNKPE